MQSVFGALGALPGKEALLAAVDGWTVALFCATGLLFLAIQIHPHLRHLFACRKLDRRLASDPFIPREELISLRMAVEDAPAPLDLGRLVARTIGGTLQITMPIFAARLGSDGWYAFALIVLGVYLGLIYCWRRLNPPPDVRASRQFQVTIPSEAKLGFLIAAATTAVFFALFLSEMT